jgi:hypothetical protein
MNALRSCGALKPVFVAGIDRRLSKVHRWRRDNAFMASVRFHSTRDSNGFIKAFGRSLEVSR